MYVCVVENEIVAIYLKVDANFHVGRKRKNCNKRVSISMPAFNLKLGLKKYYLTYMTSYLIIQIICSMVETLRARLTPIFNFSQVGWMHLRKPYGSGA